MCSVLADVVGDGLVRWDDRTMMAQDSAVKLRRYHNTRDSMPLLSGSFCRREGE